MRFYSQAFSLMPSVNAAYWILTAMTSQLELLFYSFIFAAAVKLRSILRMWIIASVAIFSSIIVILLDFIPPTDLHITSVKVYEIILIGSVLLFS